MNNYRLTILIPSYNKQDYIAQTLDSIFMQKTSYSFKIIVCDDYSSDDTLKIVDLYKQKHSNIEILYSNSNNGLYKNILRGYKKIDTDYFCVLDPDDYWIDDKKIEKALSFLDNNLNYSMYFGNTYLCANDIKYALYIKSAKKECTISFDDFLNSKYFFGHTSSTFFRNICFNLDDFLFKVVNLENNDINEISLRGDSFRNIAHLEKGLAYYTKEVDSVYRITESGIWQSQSKINQNFINCVFYKDMWNFFDQMHMPMLTMSYKIFIQNNNFDILLANNEKLDEISKLTDLFLKYKEKIHENILKKLKIKYILFYKIYLYLKNKVVSKGLV